jgi:tetratricopeptide (TPR) repeat protein
MELVHEDNRMNIKPNANSGEVSLTYLDILVVCSAPVDLRPTLNLRHELVKLQDAVRKATIPVRIRYALPPTLEKLRQLLSPNELRTWQPRVLHFLGHGEEDGLWFESVHGNKEFVSSRALGRVLQEFQIHLLLLNACWSAGKRVEGICELLTRDGTVRTAIGHPEPITDVTAVLFAAQFYRHLIDGSNVDQARIRAIADTAGQGHPDATGVRLYGDGKLNLTSELGLLQQSGVVDYGFPKRWLIPETGCFCGRAEEYLRIAAALDEPDLVAQGIWGMGGIGKTTLAWEVARRNAWRWDGGGVFVDIRDLPVSERTAAGLFRSAMGLLRPGDGGDSIALAVEHFRAAPTLFVFDNLEDLPECEHPTLIRYLCRLPRNGSRVLLTARTSMAPVTESAVVRSISLVDGLSPWDGAFYAYRVARQKGVEGLSTPRVELDKVFGPCAELSNRVHGHPLMIELGVGIAATSGIDGLEEALRDLPEALQERLESLLAAGLRLIGSEGRRLSQYLGLFASGHFILEEAEVLAVADEVWYTRVLAPDPRDLSEDDYVALVVSAATTVCVVLGLDPVGPSPRDAADLAARGRANAQKAADNLERAGLVRCDQATRSYYFSPLLLEAINRAESFDAAAISVAGSALMRFHLKYLMEHAGDMATQDRCATNALLAMELAWDRKKSVLPNGTVEAMTRVLGDYFRARGLFELGLLWQTRIEQVYDASHTEVSPEKRASIMEDRSELLKSQGRIAEARKALLDSLPLWEQANNRRGIVRTLARLGNAEAQLDNLPQARQYLEQSQKMALELGGPDTGWSIQIELAKLEHRLGNTERAIALLMQAGAASERQGDRLGLAHCWYELGYMRYANGELNEARHLFEQALSVADADVRFAPMILHDLGLVEKKAGNASEARRLFMRSLAGKRRIDDLRGEAISLGALADLEISQGESREARRLLQRVLEINAELGYESELPAQHSELAMLELRIGELKAAKGSAAAAVVAARRLESPLILAEALDTQALIAISLRDAPTARRSFQEQFDLFTASGDAVKSAETLVKLVAVEAELGDVDGAARKIEEAIGVLKSANSSELRHALDIRDKIEQMRRRQMRTHTQSSSLRQVVSEQHDIQGESITEFLANLDRRIASLLGEGKLFEAADLTASKAGIFAENGDYAACERSIEQTREMLCNVTDDIRAGTLHLVLDRFERTVAGMGQLKSPSADLLRQAVGQLEEGLVSHAVESLNSALKVLDEDPDPRAEARIRFTLAGALVSLDRDQDAGPHLLRAAQLADELDDGDLARQCKVLHNTVVTNLAMACELKEPLEELLRQAKTDNERAEVYCRRGRALVYRQPHEANRLLDRAMEYAERAGSPKDQMRAFEIKGICAVQLREWTMAIRYFRQASEIASQLDLPDAAVFLTQRAEQLQDMLRSF